MTGRPVILDTDFATDVGDVGVTALAMAAHRVGWINLLGCINGSSATKGPGAIDAVATHWGVSGLTYGAWKGTTVDATNAPYVEYIYDNHSHPNVGLAATVTDSTVAFRTMLAASSTPVDIVVVGYHNCVSTLLDSAADGVSALTGAQLVAAKVRKLWVMGGDYSGGAAEWNFNGGSPGSTTFRNFTANVLTNWPTPIVFGGFELGTYVVGNTLTSKSSGNLMREAYSTAGYSAGRTAWDETTMLAAIQEGSDFTLTRGTNAINTSTGVNTFTAGSSGNHYYLTKAKSDSWYKDRINTLIAADVAASPLISSWGSAPGLLIGTVT